jgi:hypothetical protein
MLSIIAITKKNYLANQRIKVRSLTMMMITIAQMLDSFKFDHLFYYVNIPSASIIGLVKQSRIWK